MYGHPKPPFQNLPLREYLDATVVPLVLQGMQALARERYERALCFMGRVYTLYSQHITSGRLTQLNTWLFIF